MRYVGGKHRLSKKIVPILQEHRKPGQLYIEPFMGACNVLEKMDNPRVGSDVSYDMVMLYRSLQLGWNPPPNVTKEMYYLARKYKDRLSPQLRAFLSIGCSYAGKIWGGFAQGDGRNFAAESARKLLRQNRKLIDVKFLVTSFENLRPKNALIYCDPPYKNSRANYYSTDFDHDLFWLIIKRWAKEGNTVFISEYSAPHDIALYTTFSHKSYLTNDSYNDTVEKLFCVFPNGIW